MAQHLLQAPQVGPALQKVRRKRVAQHVGRKSARNPRLFTTRPDDLPETLAGHGATPGRHEEPRRIGPAGLRPDEALPAIPKPGLKPRGSNLPVGNNALLVPLPITVT